MWERLQIQRANCNVKADNLLWVVNRGNQRDRTRRALLQYQNFNFLSYLGWSDSFPQSNNYIMKVVQYPSTEINVAGFGVRTTVLWHENLEHYP